MTGFGRAERNSQCRKIIVEIKSLNSKQLDLSARIPSLYREREHEVRTMVGKALGRGKVDVSICFETLQGTASAAGAINTDLFVTYYRELTTLAQTVGYDITAEPLMQTILRMPDVIETQNAALSDDELAALMDAVATAITNIQDFRTTEGQVLMGDLLSRVDIIENLLSKVAPFETQRIDTVRSRIMDNLEKVTVNPDSNRFEQEIIYYLEKLDITEEKVRLAQHCKYFKTVAKDDQDAGRKLGFIAQEMGREINTLGSKANHAEIQKIVVNMKDELEKIKEQLLNIL